MMRLSWLRKALAVAFAALCVYAFTPDVRVADPRHPAIWRDAGQGGEFEHAHRLPSQLGESASAFPPAGGRLPHRLRRARRLPPLGRRDEQGVAVSDRLAETVDERSQDAVVGDPAGGEQKLHDSGRLFVSQSLACRERSARK